MYHNIGEIVLRNIYLKIKNGLIFLKKRLIGRLCNCPPRNLADYTIKDLSSPRKKRKTKKKTTKRQR